jgi:hypothetical protein
MLLAVRSPAARDDMQEAIACYTAGAHRAAIVVTWTAVVYDIMAKLRELELSGDKTATKKIAEFESIRTANDVRRSQDWEREILTMARDEFELLTHQEFTDLERLRNDRHRCAHPAMDTADEPYRPPPELVRYHLRSALVHLLVQAPVQGRAALSRLASEVKSPLFPISPARALEVLKAGALRRPKDNLLRDFVIGTVKEALSGPDRADAAYQRRLATALAAVTQLHPAKVKAILQDRLPNILRSVAESDFNRILRLGDSVDDIWGNMPTDVVAKLEQFVATADFTRHPRALVRAARRAELIAVFAERIDASAKEDLKHLVAADPKRAADIPVLVDRSVALLEASKSWDTSNFIIEHLLEPMVLGSSCQRRGRRCTPHQESPARYPRRRRDTFGRIPANRRGGWIDRALSRGDGTRGGGRRGGRNRSCAQLPVGMVAPPEICGFPGRIAQRTHVQAGRASAPSTLWNRYDQRPRGNFQNSCRGCRVRTCRYRAASPRREQDTAVSDEVEESTMCRRARR